MSPQMSDTAIRKSVTVDRPLEEAFRLYTEQVATWWPFSTHSTGKEEVETVILEGREGGRFYERTKNGDEHLWGTVLVWDPPSRVVHSWHPGRAEDTAQEVEVTFAPDGEGTRVELMHSGWERLGDRVDEMITNYNEGWDVVLGRYAQAAEVG
jgi:uncharacterized protein YndB with AHSA1/START domain